MATAGDGGTTYQSGGAGGKFRKRPIRRSSPATPYDRPPIALRNNNNNNPSLFAKLVDPASRLIYAGADRLFGVFRKRLPPAPPQRQPGTNEEPRNVSQEVVPNSASKNSKAVVEPSTNEGGHLATIPIATEISDLENMFKQKTFTRSEIERLTALLHSKTTESNVVKGDTAKLPSTSYHVPRPDAFTSGTLNQHVEERETGNLDAAISTPIVSSRGVAFEEDGTSPAELAKAYMGTRPTKLSPLTMRSSSQAPRRDLLLLNNTATFSKTPTISHAPKTEVSIKTFENGLTTFRSRGRSALYNMPRTPYYRGPSTLSQKGVASPSTREHEGSIGSSRMVAKRRSSALDDIGSGGPMRRIRQKANLLSQQSSLSKYKSELGSSQKLLLSNEPEAKASKAVEETGEISKHGQNYGSVTTESSRMALKIFEQLERMSPKEKPSGSKLAGTTEKIDSPKVLSSSQDNKKSEPSFQRKDTVEEYGSRNIVGHSNVLSSANGKLTVPVSGTVSIEKKAGSTTKRSFLMSAHEDSLELDDDNRSNGHASISPNENKKLGASVLANNDVSSNSILPEVNPAPGIPEFKKGAISPGSPVVNNQKASFNFPASTSPSSGTRSSVLSQPTSVVDAVAPQNKPAVFPTFETSISNSARPSGVKTNFSPDATPLGPTSLTNSTMNNDQVQFSASNKDDNGNTQKPVNLLGNAGSSSSANLTPASASAVFSFGGSTKNSSIANGTSASSPSIFASSSSFQPSGTSTSKIFSSSSSPVVSSVTTAFLPSTTSTTSATSSAFPTSVSASIFGSGSATASSTSASMASASSFASTMFATSSNGGSTFGVSSSSATLTTNGFQANTQTASPAVTQTVPFKFGSGTSGMPSSTSGSFFSSSVPSFGLTSVTGGSNSSPTTNIFGSGASSAPSFGISSTVASSETKSGTATNNIFGTGFNSTPSFGLSSTVASSEMKSGSSTSNIFGTGFNSTPNFGLTSNVASSETKAGSSISGSATNVFGSGISSTPSFGLGSSVATSETKAGSSTSNMFGSTPFSFGASSTSMSSASTSPFMFGSSNAGASTGSSVFTFSSNSSFPAPAFGNSTPVFGASPANNNDHMSMEDSMADDSNQTPSPSVPAFAQASSGTPGFMFGSATPTAPSPGFMFGGQTNQVQPQPPPQNPFPAPGSAQFNAGGSFSLGSGGDEKSNRRIVKVKRQNRRK